MVRPKPPRNNKAYEAMKTEFTKTASGKEMQEGITIKKLVSSIDAECKKYGVDLLAFKVSNGASKADILK